MANLMDEKEKCQIGQDGHDRLSHPNHLVTPGNMANRSQRKTLFLFLLGFSLWLFFRRGPYEISTQLSPVETDRNISWVHSIHDEKASANRSALVPLEAHIMSKCPDAKDCLRDLVVPAMENIVDMVDFNLSFIGIINPDDTIGCKHGETECLGNMLSLCAKNLFPNSTVISLGFSTCLVSSYRRIPERNLVENCALEHGIAFEALNACVSEDGKGLELLRKSVERSEDAAVTKSCTVRVAGETWCIRDGGEWKDCNDGHEPKDLVAAVKKIYSAY